MLCDKLRYEYCVVRLLNSKTSSLFIIKPLTISITLISSGHRRIFSCSCINPNAIVVLVEYWFAWVTRQLSKPCDIWARQMSSDIWATRYLSFPKTEPLIIEFYIRVRGTEWGSNVEGSVARSSTVGVPSKLTFILSQCTVCKGFAYDLLLINLEYF